MTWAIVINPTSGQGKGAEVGRAVVGYFGKHDLKYQIITGKSAENVSRDLRSFLHANQECEGVLCVGGDGLAHLVLQAVVPLRIPFAVIPAGTGNDFVRALKWPLDDLENLLNIVTTQKPTPIDIGLVDGEWFGAVLSSGFDSVVNEKANSLKWPKGPSKYNLAIALELPRFKPSHFEINLDDRTLSTEAMLIAVGNGSSYGGGMRVCPNASLTDGLFDVMVLAPISKAEFIKVFPKVYSGDHVHHPEVSIYRSKKVKINSSAIAYADGERVGALPISAECVPGAGLTWRN
ncbi:MAG: YegS/Rv2252/BmrU family lipid kinase [Actinobacteria bacterium]|jgi:diacylglycerol kinase (ATP)|nr:YegS/Rv2252/BmrU family lipid kinase [Actinomycetota bacterium]NDH99868.1 YegS/Rv2252/BmrU family lipid kinase [Actinomycetota bacterium]